MGVTYLKQELANPSPSRWGRAAGPIDTGYVKSVMVGVLGIAGNEAPHVLQRYRDSAADPRLKELLTVALGEARVRSALPDLLRIARKDPEGATRVHAISVLTGFLRKPIKTNLPIPGRLRPGEVWRPLDTATQQKIAAVLIESLDDPFKHYRGRRADPERAVFPIQEEAARVLTLLGYATQPTEQGWRVLDSRGRLVRTVAFDRGKARIPSTGPRGIHQ